MKKHWHRRILIAALMSVASMYSYAQTPLDSIPGDPGALYVYTVQNMSFGAFAHGNTGGTVIIGVDGSRSVTGDVIALNLGISYFNAIFEIEGPPGAVVSLLNGPDITLVGSSGGTMSLHIGNSSPNSPFINMLAPPQRKQVSIGGTLTVGSLVASPPGTYTGTIYITFNQE